MNWLKETMSWAKKHFTRKFTVPFHVAGGVICVIAVPVFPTLGITLLIIFGLFEWWQAEVEGDCGHLDFWDAVFGAFVTAIPITVLGYVGIL